MKVVIIGAGHAGGSAAALLRASGFEGEILLAGAEPVAPYQRPPLSKAWLKGEADMDSLLLRPEDFYGENAIELRLSTRAVSIDRVARTVTFSDNAVETYDALILATGSIGRRLSLPGSDQADLLELRTFDDAERLKTGLGPDRRLVIVGGGYVGLEAAASARALGAEVVVLERMNRVLARVASETLSAFFTDRHRREGVDVRTSVEVVGFERGAVLLANGDVVTADVILTGIGALADTALAEAAGLQCTTEGSGGIVVDEDARTSDPAIYAVGDATWRPVPVHGRHMRLESVPNALEQARQAAHAIVGRERPAAEVPWFWSDQYDLKLQIAGVAIDADQQVIRGDIDAGRFAVFHLRQDRLVSVEAVNAPAEFMAGRQLIGRHAVVDARRLTDTTLSMKTIAAGATGAASA